MNRRHYWRLQKIIMDKRNIPSKLKEKQEQARLDTINKVQEAIDDIRQEGGIVTRKLLLEKTGLSNSTFSKPHVKDVLEANKVCQFASKKKVLSTTKEDVVKNLYKEIEKLKKENNVLISKLQDKEIKSNTYKQDYIELSNNYAMLLSKLHLIMKKVDEYGIDIGIDFDNL